MSWSIEIPLIVRTLINDLTDQPVYSDERLIQVITVASKYVQFEVTLDNTYTVDVSNGTLTPDPLDYHDDVFIGLVALKSACIIDQSTVRTKSATEGIRASLGPASLTVQGSLEGLKLLLETGPCALYQDLVPNWNVRDASAVTAVLSPFVGNKFNPRYLQGNTYRSRYFYS